MTIDDQPAAEWADPASLVPWERNPRKNAAAVAAVAKSIARFGFGAPVLARLADRVVIAGHTRQAAALNMGLPLIPVRFLDLDEAEAHALALADNRLGELSEWDPDVLVDVLREMSAEATQIDDLGWSAEELARMLDEAEAGAEPEDLAATVGKFCILVTCADERHQRTMLEQLDEEGIECRAWNL